MLKRGDGTTGAVVIGRLPLMLRCQRCVLRGADEAQLARLGAHCQPSPAPPSSYLIFRAMHTSGLLPSPSICSEIAYLGIF